jgi:hypothetical protein
MATNATQAQIHGTLQNMRAEIQSNGITEAASDMWAHALSMYRKSKSNEGTEIDMNDLPMFLRPQAG